MDVGRHTANITSVIYVCCVDAKSLAVTVNGSVDDASTAVVNNDVEADDDRWEQVQSRSRTVFNAAVSWHMLIYPGQYATATNNTNSNNTLTLLNLNPDIHHICTKIQCSQPEI